MLTFVRYFGVYYTFELLGCVLYKRITLYRDSLYRGSVPYILYRGSLHRSSTVPEAAERDCITKVLVVGMSK